MSEQRAVVGILLAAGKGTRFGGDKLLHRLADGTSIGAAAARHLIAAGVEVLAVLRPDDLALAALVAREGCAVTFCPAAEHGMGASLAHGVSMRPDAAAWLIALADMPVVKTATIAALVRKLEEGSAIVAPACNGRRGHPVGFARRFGAQLAALDGDAGARDIVAAHMAELTLVECDDPGVLYDVDRPDDLMN
jgi:molybdenum cofactor cytidylyltransferase